MVSRVVLSLWFLSLVAACGSKGTPAGETLPDEIQPTTQAVTCQTSADCNEGEVCRAPDGCTTPGTCQVVSESGCPGEDRELCDCHGETFVGNPSCSGRPLSRAAACEAPAFCVRQPGLDCDEPRGSCPEGQIQEYAGGCWATCIAVSLCQCSSDADCPEEAPVCDTAAGRCAAG